MVVHRSAKRLPSTFPVNHSQTASLESTHSSEWLGPGREAPGYHHCRGGCLCQERPVVLGHWEVAQTCLRMVRHFQTSPFA